MWISALFGIDSRNKQEECSLHITSTLYACVCLCAFVCVFVVCKIKKVGNPQAGMDDNFFGMDFTQFPFSNCCAKTAIYIPLTGIPFQTERVEYIQF